MTTTRAKTGPFTRAQQAMGRGSRRRLHKGLAADMEEADRALDEALAMLAKEETTE